MTKGDHSNCFGETFECESLLRCKIAHFTSTHHQRMKQPHGHESTNKPFLTFEEHNKEQGRDNW